eukprot:Tamp_22102.p4 GENE.Tamp_22102~~Tamp_22102.p4  ORF type:complete len:227 (+),score=14.20 Tamp_22102:376-1056(+)
MSTTLTSKVHTIETTAAQAQAQHKGAAGVHAAGTRNASAGTHSKGTRSRLQAHATRARRAQVRIKQVCITPAQSAGWLSTHRPRPRAPAAHPRANCVGHLLPFVAGPARPRSSARTPSAPAALAAGGPAAAAQWPAHPRLGPGGRPVPQPRLLHSRICFHLWGSLCGPRCSARARPASAALPAGRPVAAAQRPARTRASALAAALRPSPASSTPASSISPDRLSKS